VDDTVCEKTKPSSQAIFGMQGAGFHHSHTKGKRVWGHERVEQILRCGGVIFPYYESQSFLKSVSSTKYESTRSFMEVVELQCHDLYVDRENFPYSEHTSVAKEN
ncbi:hypothetical protein Q0N71_32035, partial [Bacillus thuringiensis]